MGEASWHELMTTDAAAAMKFYSDVFGWQPSDALDMGPMGTYQMFNRPHAMIGGIMNRPPDLAHVPPNWQIISLCSTALSDLVERGRFLEGLYYRLNVVYVPCGRIVGV